MNSEHFRSGKIEMSFFSLLLLIQLNTLNGTKKTNINRLWKGGVTKAGQLGTWGPEVQQGDELPRFLFASHIPDLEMKKLTPQDA